MHSEVLGAETHSDNFPYTYLLEWEWPEHIELLLRRLIWARLIELTDGADSNDVAQSDFLAAHVCSLIVKSPDTHSAVLDVLASTAVAAFAERVAEHPRADASTLARLAGHSSPGVRAAVAENANTPIEVLRNLVEDEHLDVRFAMAENHMLPAELLETLSEDDNCYVAYRAKRTLSRIAPPAVAPMPLQRTQRASEVRKRVAMG